MKSRLYALIVAFIAISFSSVAQHRVLVEEFTGAWCQFCPDGHVILDKLKQDNPDGNFVMIHQGGGTSDAMAITDGNTLASYFPGGYPKAMFNRGTAVSGTNPPSPATSNRSTWATNYTAAKLAGKDACEIVIENKTTSQDRMIMNVKVKFKETVDPSWDLRMNLYIVEDEVVGSGAGYDQVNYYYQRSGQQSHPYYNAGNPIKGYKHTNVLRAIPSTPFGTSNVIPKNPEVGVEYTREYQYRLPGTWDFSKLRVVAFVSVAGTNATSHKILNSNDLKLSANSTTSLSSVEKVVKEVVLFPNPSSNQSTLTYTLTENQNVSIRLIDMNGKSTELVNNLPHTSGAYNYQLNTQNLKSGVYKVLIQTELGTIAETLIKQ
jgi:hypothetical protein